MRLCIPAEAPRLDAAVDPRLGRAACFVVVDGETGSVVDVAENVQNKQAASGAGVQAGQTIANLDVEAVLCARCGPKAFRVLAAAGVAVYVGTEGTVAEAVRAYRKGELEQAQDANVEGHW